MAEPQIHTPRQHPAEEELIAHAAGQLDASRRVLLEGHMTYCRACREAWSDFAAPGGRLLDEVRDEAPPPRLLADLMARIESERQAVDPYAGLPLSGELLATLPRLDAAIAWGSPDRWTDDSRVACLMADRRADARLFLLEVPAGEHIPRHQHLGREHVLCLSGACSDEHIHLEPGDYYRYDPGTEHYPIMDPGEPCWIAVRVEKGVRYTP